MANTLVKNLEDTVDDMCIFKYEIEDEDETASWYFEYEGEPNCLEAYGDVSISFLHSLKMFAGRKGIFFTRPELVDAVRLAQAEDIKMDAEGKGAKKILDAIQAVLKK